MASSVVFDGSRVLSQSAIGVAEVVVRVGEARPVAELLANREGVEVRAERVVDLADAKQRQAEQLVAVGQRSLLAELGGERDRGFDRVHGLRVGGKVAPNVAGDVERLHLAPAIALPAGERDGLEGAHERRRGIGVSAQGCQPGERRDARCATGVDGGRLERAHVQLLELGAERHRVDVAAQRRRAQDEEGNQTQEARVHGSWSATVGVELAACRSGPTRVERVSHGAGRTVSSFAIGQESHPHGRSGGGPKSDDFQTQS